MKKLLALSFIGTSFFISSNPLKADWDIWGLKNSTSDTTKYEVYTINSITKEATKRTEVCTDGRAGCVNWDNIYSQQTDNVNGLLVETADGIFSEYDAESNSWNESINDDIWIDEYDNWFYRNQLVNEADGSYSTYYKGSVQFNIKPDGTTRFGSNSTDISVGSDGLKSGTDNVLIKKTNGDIHIGKNSFVIGNDLIDGAHPIWAEDENGSKVPLNIYGSDLQINGISVQGQIDTNKSNINSLGSGVAGSTALTAALTALPQTSKESKISCGVGSGAYSSRYAVGFGCASKVNERVDINAGGSYVFGGSKSYGGGTLDSSVVKAGFVFKLGELNKPTQISMKDKKVLKTKIETLEEKNKQLLARLERLEKITLIQNK